MSTATSNGHVTRFTASSPCPICKGYDGARRGQGERCYGFLSSDGKFAHCTREEHAGQCKFNAESQTYAHRLQGKCACGQEHGPAEPKRGRKWGEFDKEYVYFYEHGKPALFRVVRTKNPKGFYQQRHDPSLPGKNKWAKGLDGVTPCLYRRPELMAAGPDKTVYIVEGEKDVSNLTMMVKLDAAVTCPPMGAGKWRDPYADDLAGRRVVILPDNDKPGREHAIQVARSVSRTAASVKIVELPGLAEHGDVSDWIEQGGTLAELNRLVEEAPEFRDDQPAATNGHHTSNGAAHGGLSSSLQAAARVEAKRAAKAAARAELEEIEVTTLRHEVVEQTIRALASVPNLYYRGDLLVTVVEDQENQAALTHKSVLLGTAGSPRIITLSDSNIGCHLTSCASFYTMRKVKGEDVPEDVHPPDWLIRSIATRKYWPGLRPLVAVAECPYPRADGSIVETPGYDAETGTLYRPSMAFPRVPSNPTRDDARKAWEQLAAPIWQFPFASDDDKAVWLAGLLSVIARPAIPGPVPGIALVGNKAGCGKGRLIDSIGVIAHGRSVPTTSYPDDPTEAKKVKTAIALAGKSIVHLDNLDEGTTYGNSGLDSALTSDTTDDRILGTSQNTGDIPLRACWFLSGNNIAPAKDAYRRWLPCNLVTDKEHPEERDDLETPDLLAYIQDHRAELVVAALTILRAHAIAKEKDKWPPKKWAPLGTYEQWDPIVRGAVWYATDRDCCTTRRKAAEKAPARLAKIALLEGWLELPGGDNNGVTTAKAVELANADPERYPTLHNALLNFGRDGKLATARSLGNIIRGMQENLIDGKKFANAGEEHRAVKWCVKSTKKVAQAPQPSQNDKNPGESGESGECPPYPNHAGSRVDNYPSQMSMYGGNSTLDGVGCGEDSPDSPDSPTLDSDPDCMEEFEL